MKLNRDMVRAIKKKICTHTFGGRYELEYGERASAAGTGDRYGYTGNALLWTPDADLYDTALLTSGTIIGDESRAGMVLLDVYVYHVANSDSSLSGNVWVLLSELGELLATDNDYNRIMRAVDVHTAEQLVKRKCREIWAATATKWRERSGMPFGSPKSRKRAPLAIVADWVQDQDGAEAREDETVLRAALAAGFVA